MVFFTVARLDQTACSSAETFPQDRSQTALRVRAFSHSVSQPPASSAAENSRTPKEHSLRRDAFEADNTKHASVTWIWSPMLLIGPRIGAN